MFRTVPVSDGRVHSSVRLWLRLEGFMALLVATYLYAHEGGSWLAFAVLFFAPDVSFAGYIAGPRAGAALYNVAHSYVGPLILAATLLSAGAGLTFALVWGAHIRIASRALGYGPEVSAVRLVITHLGHIVNKVLPAHVDGVRVSRIRTVSRYSVPSASCALAMPPSELQNVTKRNLSLKVKGPRRANTLFSGRSSGSQIALRRASAAIVVR